MKCPHCGKPLSGVKLKVLYESLLIVYPDGQSEIDDESYTVRAILCPHCGEEIKPHGEKDEYLFRLMDDVMKNLRKSHCLPARDECYYDVEIP